MGKKGGFFPRIGHFLGYLRKHWKRSLLILIGLIIVFLIIRKINQQPAGITSTKVTRGALVSDFSANGNIKAKKEIDLKFFSPGKVTWIGVKNGDAVRSGQGVASLDTVSLNASYQQALNNLRNYQAITDSVLDTVQGHETDETFAQRATRTTAQVNRDNAYQSIQAAQDNLSNAVLVSPFAGTVINTNDIVAGENLSGADIESKFIRIVDLSSLYFSAKVDETDYSNVKVGQEVSIDVDAFPGQSCSGSVSYVSRDGQETNGGVITIPVEVVLKNCNLDFAVGLNGQARFVLSKKENVLMIPKKYVINSKGQDFVWKQIGSTIKDRKQVAVKIGSTTSTEAEIKDGLSEGDTIIFIP